MKCKNAKLYPLNTTQLISYWYSLLLVLIAIALSACGSSGSGSSDDNSSQNGFDDSGLLIPVQSAQAFVESFQASEATRSNENFEINTSVRPIAGGEVFSLAADFGANADITEQYSATYTLEDSVGESDVVKYNGQHLFVARQKQFSCCYFIDLAPITRFGVPIPSQSPEAQLPSADVTLIGQQITLDSTLLARPAFTPSIESVIRILASDTDTATVSEVGQIDIPENENILGLFLAEDNLVAITSASFFAPYGDIWRNPFAWFGTDSGIKIYDVSEVSEPTLDWDINIEGGLAQSRRIGDTLYLVTRNHVNVGLPSTFGRLLNDTIDNTITALRTAALEESMQRNAAIDGITMDDLISKISINGVESDLYDAKDCYINNEKMDTLLKPASSQVVTTITALNINNPNQRESLCLPENTSGVYLSESAIYLNHVHSQTVIENQQSINRSSTRIHKFALKGLTIDYRGSADVAGALWSSGQRDFRINEYNNQLRVVTTQWLSNNEDRFDHYLHILEEDPDSLSLRVISTLPNESQPEEIGKANENLYGVRFQGDRAFVVTFLQVDPFYVLDLSNASAPFIAGELEIPGFSDFLHPINNDLLLGLGREGRHVKLELFNISDITQPLSQQSLIVEPQATSSWSTAQYNRHAFTFLNHAASDTFRFAIPVNSNALLATDSYNSLYEFEIGNTDLPLNSGISEVGRIRAINPSSGFYGEERSVLHDDAVFFIRSGEVWSSFWGSRDDETGPQ